MNNKLDPHLRVKFKLDPHSIAFEHGKICHQPQRIKLNFRQELEGKKYWNELESL